MASSFLPRDLAEGWAAARLALACAATVLASEYLLAPPQQAPLLGLVGGVALAGLVRGGRTGWPGILLGVGVSAGLVFWEIPFALLVALGVTGGAVVGAAVLRRWQPRFDAALAAGADLRALGMAALAGGGVSALAQTLGSLGAEGDLSLPLLFAEIWAGDALGTLLGAALLLTWTAAPGFAAQFSALHTTPARRQAEATALGAALLVAVGVSAAELWAPNVWGYLLAPVLAWAALRFPVRTTALVTAAAAVLAMAADAWWTLPLSGYDDGLGALDAVALLALTTVPALAVAVAHQRSRRAAADADALSRAKTAFLARQSLDLRTPLTGILSAARTLADTPAGAASHPETGTRLVASSTFLDHALGDLHDLALLDAGTYRPDPEPLDVAVAVEARMALFQPEAADRGVALHVCTPLLRPFAGSDAPDPLCARAAASPADTGTRVDIDAFQRMLAHAVGYALREARHHVRVAVAVEGPWVELHVQHDGDGLPPEQRAPLAAALAPRTPHVTPAYDGLPLALVLTHALATLHSGTFRLDAAGCTLTVSFPHHPA